MYARITKDLLYTGGDDPIPNRTEYTVLAGIPQGQLQDVRLLDDDRIPYYVLVADEESFETLLSWAMRDSGATILQTKEGGAWVDCMN